MRVRSLRGNRPADTHYHYDGIEGSFFYTGQYVVRHLTTDVTGAESEDARILIEAGYDPEVRVTFQERAGIDAELLFPTLFSAVMQIDDGHIVQTAARAYNDWIAEYCAPHPSRLIGNAVVPLHEPEWAVGELKRAREKGLRAALINTVAPVGRPPLRDPCYDPFWSVAEDLDMPVLIHIVTGRVQDPIVYSITPDQLAEAPKGIHEMWHEVQTTLSNEFIFGGILDRHPKLKLIDAEYDISWLLYFMFRDDQIHEQFRGILDLPNLKMKPSDYLKTRIWHGMTDDPFGIDTIPGSAPIAFCGARISPTCVRSTTTPRKRSRTSTEICPWPIRRRSWGRTWRRCSGYRSWCEPEGVSLMVQRPLMKHHQMYRVARATREAEAAS